MRVRLIKNISSQFVTYILQLITSIILAVLLGKLLGPQGLGRFSFVTTFVVMFAFLCDWGLNILIIREVSRKKDQLSKYINNTMGLGLVFSIIALGIITIIISLLRYTFLLRLHIYLASIWMILGVFISFFTAAFHAFEKMEYEAIALAIEKFFLLVIAPFILIFWKSLSLLLLMMIVSRILNLLTGFVIYNKNLGSLGIEFNRELWMSLFKSTLPFGLNILFSNIYLSSDVVLLGFMKTEAETGLYRAATAIVSPFGIISLSVNNALFPIFSRGHLTSKDSISLGLTKLLKYLFIVGFLLTALIIIFPEQIIGLLYTREFIPSIIALKILSIIIPLRFANNTLSIAITASNLQKYRSLSLGIAALSNILMNLLVVPRWGYIGTSVTTVITDVIIFSLLLYFVFRFICAISLLRIIYKPIISAIFMGILVIFLRRIVSFAFIIITAPIIYFTILYFIGGTSKKDLSEFFTLIGRIK